MLGIKEYNMFDLIKKMLPLTDSKYINENKDLQILDGKYKIPSNIKEVLKQNKYK